MIYNCLAQALCLGGLLFLTTGCKNFYSNSLCDRGTAIDASVFSGEYEESMMKLYRDQNGNVVESEPTVGKAQIKGFENGVVLHQDLDINTSPTPVRFCEVDGINIVEAIYDHNGTTYYIGHRLHIESNNKFTVTEFQFPTVLLNYLGVDYFPSGVQSGSPIVVENKELSAAELYRIGQDDLKRVFVRKK